MVNHAAGFIFPGQGSQQVGMGRDFFERYPAARRRFEEASSELGFDLGGLCFEGPKERLDQDLQAQLAVYTVSCIVTDLLAEAGVRPSAVSGYSSGFYAAAYAAGCFDFRYGLHLVRRAGEILDEHGMRAGGGMAVVFGLSARHVAHICRRAGGVEVAILNTPRQTVISGRKDALERAMAMARQEDALDAYPLEAATAYHSSYMKGATKRFLEEIDPGRMRRPAVPILSYSFLEPVETPRALRTAMAEQLSLPVRWVELIRRLAGQGVGTFVEVGPGLVLSRTVRWIDRSLRVMDTATTDRLREVVETLGQEGDVRTSDSKPAGGRNP
ncbi:MAG: acyltransferase domain-containing protein [Deltaproteobacteria bacterium]|nr:acyltransferase domain-containing protein [Deltaproteobacteria bacterium]MBW1948501.1 acyltransferase domain-containing protein [Deltaproteobacteria bacterium]MBW2006666.1 acyltransferase domain-containing protein [Deltaproteobacteria bacterium]MBW2349026.1 acyltransferase domain-containing protein [Deltaproteobacteria bacterium]